jgi:hypothetical protein
MTAVSPAESAGTVDITVQTEVGTSATNSNDHYTFTSPQLLAGPPRTNGPAPAKLTNAELQPIVRLAERDLKLAGYNVGLLAGVTFHITALGTANGPLGATDAVLGLSSGNTIWIDQNAGGFGWYTGATNAAFRDHIFGREYQATAGSPATGKVDLLTVVLHELGHVLGYPDIAPSLEGHDWMTETLGTGIRRLPDAVRVR